MKLQRSIRFYLLFLFLASPAISFSQMDTLRNRIEQIVEKAAGRIGVAIMNINNGDTLMVNGNDNYPMQSVYKFPLALAVLHQVDKGTLSLNQRIHVNKADLLPNTWSPFREKYPNGNVDITLDELLTVTVSQSDNNGCDILFRLIGGPNNVDQYIHSLGIHGMTIAATEQEMHTNWDIQYRNHSSPFAMATLLARFYHDSILSQKSKEYLWQIMVNTSTGANRLKGKLPEGTIVGHKTGSSGTNERGITAATNDVGIILLPDKISIVIVVFVSESSAKENVREEIISDIAKAVWDVYPNKY